MEDINEYEKNVKKIYNNNKMRAIIKYDRHDLTVWLILSAHYS